MGLALSTKISACATRPITTLVVASSKLECNVPFVHANSVKYIPNAGSGHAGPCNDCFRCADGSSETPTIWVGQNWMQPWPASNDVSND